MAPVEYVIFQVIFRPIKRSLRSFVQSIYPMSTIVAPSILSADFANLKQDIELVNRSEADWFHIDVMDGMFVPNISFGFPVMEAIKKHAEKPMDVHLMIEQPERYIERFRDAGAEVLTVHVEASPHLHRTLQAIRKAGMKAGVALNPHTAVSQLENVIPELDLILIMSVNPGFGGQKFIPQAIRKVKEMKGMLDEAGSDAIIEVDGGVNTETGKELVEAGAGALVAGNFVFGADDPEARISSLKAL